MSKKRVVQARERPKSVLGPPINGAVHEYLLTSDQGDLALAVVLRGHVDDLNRRRHVLNVYVVMRRGEMERNG